MNKKKLVSLCLVLALAITAAIGGTMAYFTDKDEKTNTFTVGDVNIHIDEWMEDEEGNWEEYTDEQELAPIAQSKAPFNKLVETVNDGENDAYIRTFVTCPSDLYWQLGYGFNGPTGTEGSDGTVAKDNTVNGKTIHCLDAWTDIGKITIGDEEYNVFMCENYDPVKAGDSVLSLTKVWIYEAVKNAQIGDGFEVKVYSEAIQADNLTYDEAMKSLNNGKTDLQHAAELFN